MKRKKRILTYIWFVFMVIVSIFMLAPLITSLITSFTPTELLSEKGILPSSYTLENYKNVFVQVPMLRYIFNSLFLAVIGVILNLFFASLAGYAFAKLKFRGREPMFMMLVASLMIAGIAIMIPQYIMIKSIPLVGGNNIFGQGGSGLVNNYLAIIIPGAAGAYGIFMMRQFYMKIPNELIECSRLDGLTEFGIYRKVFLPISKPALTALGLITFQSWWNNFMWPLIVINDKSKYTVQLGLSNLAGTASMRTPDYGVLMAASVLVIIPTIVIFLLGNKYFAEGLAATGSKE